MFLYKMTFGPCAQPRAERSEEIASDYLNWLYWGGNIGEEDFLVVQKRKLCAFVEVPGRQAMNPKFHTSRALTALQVATAHFGRAPVWQCIDDELPKRETTWKGAPFLYLHTSFRKDAEALYRGDNGKSVPLYRLPGGAEAGSEIVRWRRHYRQHDAIWMSCGPLEIPVWRQMVQLETPLSQEGRGRAWWVESITSIPTYYFLPRYWGRERDEEKRRCPGCGGKWRSSYPPNPDHFWHFAFKCDRCRLVSEMASCYDDERHASIGEWKGRPAPPQK